MLISAVNSARFFDWHDAQFMNFQPKVFVEGKHQSGCFPFEPLALEVTGL
jgi:hypothetical protein